MIAYLADALAKAIQAQAIKGLGDDSEQAAEIVYHSMAGALALARGRNVPTWKDILEQVSVLPGSSGEPGTSDQIIEEIEQMLGDEGAGESIRRFIDRSDFEDLVRLLLQTRRRL